MRSASFPARLIPHGVGRAELAATPTIAIPLVGLAGVLLGIALVAKPMVVYALLALGIAVVGVAIVYARPDVAFGGLVAILALIPTYASPSIGPLLFIPAAAASWAIAGAIMWRNAITEGVLFKPNYIDLAVGIFVGLMLISVSFSKRAEFTDYVHNMFMWAGPYIGARLLLSKVEHPVKVVALSFAIVTVVLAPIAAAEALGGSNPFYGVNLNGGEHSLWAVDYSRFGSTRAVASFGHPIAFSMFLAISALLSIAMGISTKEEKPRLLWYGAAALAIGTMALALSRTGWVMVGVGVVLLAVVSVRGPVRKRLLTLFGIVVAVIVVISVVMPHELSVLPGFGHSNESNYNTSGLYREALLERALQPGVLGPWGNPVNKVTPAVNFGTATDNAYIILADTWGLIPTFALFAVAGTLLFALFRSYGTPGEPISILPICAFTCLVAIFFVAFITQQQALIWMMIGCAGASAEVIAKRRGRMREEERWRYREVQRRNNLLGGL